MAKKVQSAKKVAQKDDPSRRRRRPKPTLGSFIYRVLKQVHPDRGINKRGMATIETMLMDVFDKLVAEGNQIAQRNGRATLNLLDMKGAVKLVFGSQSMGTAGLTAHAVAEGQKAVNKFMLKQGKPTPRSELRPSKPRASK